MIYSHFDLETQNKEQDMSNVNLPIVLQQYHCLIYTMFGISKNYSLSEVTDRDCRAIGRDVDTLAHTST